VEKQVENCEEEKKLLEEIVEELKAVEGKLDWEGCELEWKRLPGLNWVRYCPGRDDSRRYDLLSED